MPPNLRRQSASAANLNEASSSSTSPDSSAAAAVAAAQRDKWLAIARAATAAASTSTAAIPAVNPALAKVPSTNGKKPVKSKGKGKAVAAGRDQDDPDSDYTPKRPAAKKTRTTSSGSATLTKKLADAASVTVPAVISSPEPVIAADQGEQSAKEAASMAPVDAEAVTSKDAARLAKKLAKKAEKKRRKKEAKVLRKAEASEAVNADTSVDIVQDADNVQENAATSSAKQNEPAPPASPVKMVVDEEIDELESPAPTPVPAKKKRKNAKKAALSSAPVGPVASLSQAMMPGSPMQAGSAGPSAPASPAPKKNKKRPRSNSVAAPTSPGHAKGFASPATTPARVPAKKKRKLAPATKPAPAPALASTSASTSTVSSTFSDVYPIFLDSIQRAHPTAFAPPLGPPMLSLLKTFIEQLRGTGSNPVEVGDEQSVLFEVLKELWRRGLGERCQSLVRRAGEVVEEEKARGEQPATREPQMRSSKGKAKANTAGQATSRKEQVIEDGDAMDVDSAAAVADSAQALVAAAEAASESQAEAARIQAKLDKKEAKRKRQEAAKAKAAAAAAAEAAQTQASLPSSAQGRVRAQEPNAEQLPSGPVASASNPLTTSAGTPAASQRSSASGDKPRRNRLGKKEKAELRAAVASSSAEPSPQSSPAPQSPAFNRSAALEVRPSPLAQSNEQAAGIKVSDTQVQPDNDMSAPRGPTAAQHLESSPAFAIKQSASQFDQDRPPAPSSEFATAEEDGSGSEPDTIDDEPTPVAMDVDQPPSQQANGATPLASPAVKRLAPALEIRELPPTPDRSVDGEVPGSATSTSSSRRHRKSMSSVMSSDEDPEELALSLRAHASPARNREQPLHPSPLAQAIALPTSSSEKADMIEDENAATRKPEQQERAAEAAPVASEEASVQQQSLRPEDIPLPPSPTGSDLDMSVAPPPLRRLETIGGDEDSGSDSSSDDSSSESEESDGDTPVKPPHPRRTSLHRVATDAFGKPGSARKPRSSLAKVTSPSMNRSSQGGAAEEEDDFDQLLSQTQPKSRLSLAHILHAEADDDDESARLNRLAGGEDEDDDDAASSHFSAVGESREISPQPLANGTSNRKSRDSSEYPDSAEEEASEAGQDVDVGASNAQVPPSTALQPRQVASRRLSDIASVASSQLPDGPGEFDLSNESQSQDDAFKSVADGDTSVEESQFVGLRQREGTPLFIPASQLQEVTTPSANPLESSQFTTLNGDSEINGISHAMDLADTPRKIVVSPPSEDESAQLSAAPPTPGRVTRAALARASSPVMHGPRTPRAAASAAAGGKRVTRASSVGLPEPTDISLPASQPTTRSTVPRAAALKMPSASQPLPVTRPGKRASGMKSLSQLDEEAATPKRTRRAATAQPPATAPSRGAVTKSWIANGADDDDDEGDSSSDNETGGHAAHGRNGRGKKGGSVPPGRARKSLW